MPAGRFAPSPTGPLHLGNLRTALLAWLFARSTGSRFHLRIEDLDVAAARPEHETSHRRDLLELGLAWDPPLVRQSEQRPAHDAAIAQLARAGLTYPCWCSRKEILEASAAPNRADQPEGAYPGTCRRLSATQRAAREASGRRPALRLAAGGVEVTVDDDLRGSVTAVVDDIVLRRADGTPAYNLAVVVDDVHQRVEQVVRADDLLVSTPRQVHLARLLDLPVPRYAHVPLVLGPDGSRLAKRHGSVTLRDRVRAGESAVGVRSHLAASIGLADPGERPSLDELLARFDLARVPRSPWRLSPADV